MRFEGLFALDRVVQAAFRNVDAAEAAERLDHLLRARFLEGMPSIDEGHRVEFHEVLEDLAEVFSQSVGVLLRRWIKPLAIAAEALEIRLSVIADERRPLSTSSAPIEIVTRNQKRMTVRMPEPGASSALDLVRADSSDQRPQGAVVPSASISGFPRPRELSRNSPLQCGQSAYQRRVVADGESGEDEAERRVSTLGIEDSFGVAADLLGGSSDGAGAA